MVRSREAPETVHYLFWGHYYSSRVTLRHETLLSIEISMLSTLTVFVNYLNLLDSSPSPGDGLRAWGENPPRPVGTAHNLPLPKGGGGIWEMIRH